MAQIGQERPVKGALDIGAKMNVKALTEIKPCMS